MTDAGPRFCKDCRYAIPPDNQWDAYECDHPTSIVPPSLSLVTGETKPARRDFCHVARSPLNGHGCGDWARFFEPRATSRP